MCFNLVWNKFIVWSIVVAPLILIWVTHSWSVLGPFTLIFFCLLCHDNWKANLWIFGQNILNWILLCRGIWSVRFQMALNSMHRGKGPSSWLIEWLTTLKDLTCFKAFDKSVEYIMQYFHSTLTSFKSLNSISLLSSFSHFKDVFLSKVCLHPRLSVQFNLTRPQT